MLDASRVHPESYRLVSPRFPASDRPRLPYLSLYLLARHTADPYTLRSLQAVSLCAKANGGEEDVEAAMEEAADKARGVFWGGA